MYRLHLGLALAAILVVGCKGGSSTGATQPPMSDLTGTWYGRMAQETDGTAASALLASTTFTLDLHKDGRYELSAMSSPVEGSYTVEGTKLTLNADTIMGKKLDDSNSPIAEVFAELKQPQHGEIRDGGETIVLFARESVEIDVDLRFTRDKPKEPALGPKTATAEEMKLVGEWVFDESFDPRSKPKPNETRQETAQRKAQEFALNMVKQSTLKLREDNTFLLNMMIETRGKWKRDGDRIVLEAKEPREALEMQGGPPRIEANLAKGGAQLLMLNDKTGKPYFAMKRV